MKGSELDAIRYVMAAVLVNEKQHRDSALIVSRENLIPPLETVYPLLKLRAFRKIKLGAVWAKRKSDELSLAGQLLFKHTFSLCQELLVSFHGRSSYPTRNALSPYNGIDLDRL